MSFPSQHSQEDIADANVRQEYPQSIQAFRFSTQDEQAKHQLDAWHCVMEHSIDVSRPQGPNKKRGFSATLDAWDINGIGVVSMSMPGQGYERSWTNAVKPQTDHWSFLIPVRDGLGNPYPRRTMAITSLGRPFEGASADTQVVSAFLPRDLLPDVTAVLDAARNPYGLEGTAGLLIDFILSLQQRLQQGMATSSEVLNGLFRSMLLAGLSPSRERIEMATPTINTLVLQRIQKYIRANVTSPALNADDICRQFGMSRSGLYRLFEELGGVEGFIKLKRMESVHRAIETGDPRSIFMIAADYGFLDPSAFSRSFRHCFGYTPSDVRLSRGKGTMLPSTSPRSFDAFLTSLKAT